MANYTKAYLTKLENDRATYQENEEENWSGVSGSDVLNACTPPKDSIGGAIGKITNYESIEKDVGSINSEISAIQSIDKEISNYQKLYNSAFANPLKKPLTSFYQYQMTILRGKRKIHVNNIINLKNSITQKLKE